VCGCQCRTVDCGLPAAASLGESSLAQRGSLVPQNRTNSVEACEYCRTVADQRGDLRSDQATRQRKPQCKRIRLAGDDRVVFTDETDRAP
jgi:hypothetical protein